MLNCRADSACTTLQLNTVSSSRNTRKICCFLGSICENSSDNTATQGTVMSSSMGFPAIEATTLYLLAQRPQLLSSQDGQLAAATPTIFRGNINCSLSNHRLAMVYLVLIDDNRDRSSRSPPAVGIVGSTLNAADDENYDQVSRPAGAGSCSFTTVAACYIAVRCNNPRKHISACASERCC